MGLQSGKDEVSEVGSYKDHFEFVDIVREFSRDDGKIYLKEVEKYLNEPRTITGDKFKRLFLLFTLITILMPTASLSIPKKWLLPLEDTSPSHP
ncbi:hypothetical protein ACLB2K_045608 [Fragaria x ananassa]